MKTKLFSWVLLAGVAGCGGGGDSTTTEVYAYRGVLQCTGGGVTLTQQRAQLEGAGVSVLSASCGTDGMLHAAVCGAESGEIGVFTIPGDQTSAASKAGFASLSGRPAAKTKSCS
jgi:hypothetical protein